MARRRLTLIISSLILISIACTSISFNSTSNETEEVKPTLEIPEITPILEQAIPADQVSPDEPVFVSGTVPFTSPFFLDSATEPFVLLEDEAGFVNRDLLFEFPLEGQAMGPVWQIDDNTMGYSLSLPAVPQGTLVDVDNNGQENKGLMVFAVAYWSNIWGGPFLEEREGTGWSTANTTALTDAERDYEIVGGHLIIWAPDDQQMFPSGFGEDEMLFTEDDPVVAVPPGYSIVDLNSEPFNIYKESNPEFELIEGTSEVKDYSNMGYEEAFDAMFDKVSVEYPFTKEKGIDWDALYAKYSELVADARNDADFYLALHNFTLDIPDAHVGIGFNDTAVQVFYEEQGGSFGIVLAELSDGRVIVTEVLPGLMGDRVGMEVGAEIITWDGKPIQQAIDEVEPFFGPYSTDQHKRLDQLVFLTRYPPNTRIDVSFKNPGGSTQEATMTAEVDYDSLFNAIPFYTQDPIELPVQAYSLDNGVVYMKISTFSDDLNLMAQTFEHYIDSMIDEDAPGLIIDLRVNGGGSGGLAADFAGYFFDEEIEVSQRSYYNHLTGEFEYGDYPTTIEPGPLYYDGPVVILVSPNCISACEGFAYWMTLNDRATVIGHAGTAGAFGEVGRGQYTMPGDFDMQFPTGRPETMDGQVLIEGVGIQPDIVVPVTFESALGQVDAVLEAAIEYLK